MHPDPAGGQTALPEGKGRPSLRTVHRFEAATAILVGSWLLGILISASAKCEGSAADRFLGPILGGMLLLGLTTLILALAVQTDVRRPPDERDHVLAPAVFEFLGVLAAVLVGGIVLFGATFGCSFGGGGMNLP
jgi:hypothetical protein